MQEVVGGINIIPFQDDIIHNEIESGELLTPAPYI